MSFSTLVAIGLAGLCGPLLGLGARIFVPIVIGEILAGILVGPSVLAAVHPAGATISFLAEIGFAMLMLTVGMHLPLRDPRLIASMRAGGALAALVALLAVPAGLLAAAVAGSGHAAVYAVLLASGSAAVLLPAMQEAGIVSQDALVVMAQVTIADVVTILAVPIVLQPGRVGHAALGAALVAGAVLALLAVVRSLEGRAWVRRVRALSKRRHWALDLRLALLVLFVLAWIAQRSGTSILIAGFGAGLMVALVGGPKRLSTQIRGVADGFFIPLYFVVLGARLDLGGLFASSSLLALAGVLAALNVLIHVLAAGLLHRPPAAGLAATAQLGVPAAVASIGLSEHLFSATLATAIVTAAVVSLGVCTLGVDRLIKRARAAPGAQSPGPLAPQARPS